MLKLNGQELYKVSEIQRSLFDLAVTRAQSDVRSCLSRLRELVGASGAFAFYFHAGSPVVVSDSIGEQISDYFFANWSGFDRDGFFLFSDPELETINRMRRSLGSGVHHESKIGARDEIERTRYFQDAFQPAGMHHVVGMSARLPIGEAVFAFGFSGPEDPGFQGDRTEALLQLVLPTFEHAFNTLYANSPSAEDVAKSLQHLPCAAALVDSLGNVVDANALYLDLPEVTSADPVLRVLGPVLEGCRPSELVLVLGQTVQAFDLTSAAHEAGLSARLVEVAKLMVEGFSNPEIADKLEISIFTVRRHAEAVLDRLGVTSRAAILPALMARASIAIR
ncbi:MAG: LuxR C-terminal-related transcriptional regulator [Henriciella sp.]|uniref:helix-turn-helix transcriptional regulator n=1 Tax=Henriciella sp. TaxID=1968823 RepID=UPI0032EFF218